MRIWQQTTLQTKFTLDRIDKILATKNTHKQTRNTHKHSLPTEPKIYTAKKLLSIFATNIFVQYVTNKKTINKMSGEIPQRVRNNIGHSLTLGRVTIGQCKIVVYALGYDINTKPPAHTHTNSGLDVWTIVANFGRPCSKILNGFFCWCAEKGGGIFGSVFCSTISLSLDCRVVMHILNEETTRKGKACWIVISFGFARRGFGKRIVDRWLEDRGGDLKGEF